MIPLLVAGVGSTWIAQSVPSYPLGDNVNLNSVGGTSATDLWLGGAWARGPSALVLVVEPWDGGPWTRTRRPCAAAPAAVRTRRGPGGPVARRDAVRGSGGGKGDDLKNATQDAAKKQRELDALLARWTDEKEVSDGLQATSKATQEKQAELEAAASAGDVAKAAELRYGALKFLGEQQADLDARWQKLSAAGVLVPAEVGPDMIAEVVARRAGIPISRMMESERERLLKLEERLRMRVLGQDDAADHLADAARRMRADLRTKRKPASFLFVCPTGVGKTELAQGLAEALFDQDSALIRIDMAEYKDTGSVSGMIGSRPGLVGAAQGGCRTPKG